MLHQETFGIEGTIEQGVQLAAQDDIYQTRGVNHEDVPNEMASHTDQIDFETKLSKLCIKQIKTREITLSPFSSSKSSKDKSHHKPKREFELS